MYVTRNRCPICTSFIGKRTTLSAYIYLARLITDGVKPHTTRHNDRKRTALIPHPQLEPTPPDSRDQLPDPKHQRRTHHSSKALTLAVSTSGQNRAILSSLTTAQPPPAQSNYRPDKKPRARPNRGTAKSIRLVDSSRLTRSCSGLLRAISGYYRNGIDDRPKLKVALPRSEHRPGFWCNLGVRWGFRETRGAALDYSGCRF